MKEKTEGIIRYEKTFFSYPSPLTFDEIAQVEKWREKLFEHHLIGFDSKNQVGFGNISIKAHFEKYPPTHCPQFIISGSQTGHISQLTPNEYVRILDYNLDQFSLVHSGLIDASSESLTHASIYSAHSKIGAVIHSHHAKLWNALILSEYDCISKEIEYGTPELAKAVKKIIKSSCGTFVTKGHEDGIFVYAESIDLAGEIMMKLFHEFVSNS